jgi:hypothetical protein
MGDDLRLCRKSAGLIRDFVDAGIDEIPAGAGMGLFDWVPRSSRGMTKIFIISQKNLVIPAKAGIS